MYAIDNPDEFRGNIVKTVSYTHLRAHETQ